MPRFSRRSFLHLSAAASAAAAFRGMTEPMLAAAARRRPHAENAVLIDSNENPLGPCQTARDAVSAIIPLGGRYSDNLTDDLVTTFAQQEGLKTDSVYCTAGSGHTAAESERTGLHFRRRRVMLPRDPGIRDRHDDVGSNLRCCPRGQSSLSPRVTRMT